VASFGQAYDRAGNVTAEYRAIGAAAGVNGSGAQTFRYDGLDRVIRARLAGTVTDYEYDLDGNRRKVNTDSYAFSRADQLTSGPNGSSSTTASATSPRTANRAQRRSTPMTPPTG
jgi:YD repeat-containing protein